MKIILPSLTIIALSIGLSGCVTTYPDPYPAIKMVDSGAVSSCKQIGHFSSNVETPYGLFSDTAREKMMSNAKTEANKLGANTIVLSNPVTIEDTISITGLAYICP